MTSYQQYPQAQQAPRTKVVQVPVPQDGSGVLALRCIAYVLTSIASLLFIALVVYGYVELQQALTALEDMFGGPVPWAPPPPPVAPPPPGG